MKDNKEIVMESLQSIHSKPQGRWVMIRCPFPPHEDSTPSLGVYVSNENPERLGSFNCLGCGEKGRWNKLAEQLGFPKIDDKQVATPFDLISKESESDMLSTTTRESILSNLQATASIPWPPSLEWRGFSGKVMSRAGALICMDNYADSVQAVFLIKFNGVYRGGVKAVYEKKEGTTSYYTMRGEWVKKYGLLFHDLALRIINKHQLNFVVLVEGPRDALRLLVEGIPAIAILGAATMSPAKATTILLLGTITVYVLPDNDKGGEVLWRACKSALSSTNVKKISLPKGKKKIDPGNMSEKLMDELKDHLRNTTNFK